MILFGNRNTINKNQHLYVINEIAKTNKKIDWIKSNTKKGKWNVMIIDLQLLMHMELMFDELKNTKTDLIYAKQNSTRILNKKRKEDLFFLLCNSIYNVLEEDEIRKGIEENLKLDYNYVPINKYPIRCDGIEENDFYFMLENFIDYYEESASILNKVLPDIVRNFSSNKKKIKLSKKRLLKYRVDLNSKERTKVAECIIANDKSNIFLHNLIKSEKLKEYLYEKYKIKNNNYHGNFSEKKICLKEDIEFSNFLKVDLLNELNHYKVSTNKIETRVEQLSNDYEKAQLEIEKFNTNKEYNTEKFLVMDKFIKKTSEELELVTKKKEVFIEKHMRLAEELENKSSTFDGDLKELKIKQVKFSLEIENINTGLSNCEETLFRINESLRDFDNKADNILKRTEIIDNNYADFVNDFNKNLEKQEVYVEKTSKNYKFITETIEKIDRQQAELSKLQSNDKQNLEKQISVEREKAVYYMEKKLQDNDLTKSIEKLIKQNKELTMDVSYLKKQLVEMEEEKIKSSKMKTHKIHEMQSFNESEYVGKPEQIIYSGAPGTGKSYQLKEFIKRKEYESLRITFHPEYEYHNFIGSIMPYVEESTVLYKFTSGPFVEVLKSALHNPKKKFALVIEEMTRANCSATFGDIFQLLDRDKDGWSMYPIENRDIYNEIKVKVEGKFEKNKISLPPNLSIFGTLNTSDQSTYSLDTAFKRRFEFKHIDANASDKQDKKVMFAGKQIPWKNFYINFNKHIVNTLDLGEDKQIGPYFISEESTKNHNCLDKVFNYIYQEIYSVYFRHSKEDIFIDAYDSLEGILSDYAKKQVLCDELHNEIKG